MGEVILRVNSPDSGKEEKKCVQAGWNGWRKVSREIYDRRLYKMVVLSLFPSCARAVLS